MVWHCDFATKFVRLSTVNYNTFLYITLEIYSKRVVTKLFRLKNRPFYFTLRSTWKIARRQKGFEFGSVYRLLI